MINELEKIFTKALKSLDFPQMEIKFDSSSKFGDYSSNIAMQLKRKINDNPLVIAQKIVKKIDAPFIKKIEVMPPGFINIFINKNVSALFLKEILNIKNKYQKKPQNQKINIEYISANPTGYLHIGHARIAAIGSTLANILKFLGNEITQEYYINDAGEQINILGMSLWYSYQSQGQKTFEKPEVFYAGEEIKIIAKQMLAKSQNQYLNIPYEDCKKYFQDKGISIFLKTIKEHLKLFNVKMDKYVSEKKISTLENIDILFTKLKKHIFKKNDSLWLKTTDQGDDKDRVIQKKNGQYTYFANDVIYHEKKFSCGYDQLINIWGADHIGYMKRMKIALNYLNYDPQKLKIVMVQLVNIFNDQQKMKMSKRNGTSFWLKKLIDQVGADGARFHLLNRANTSILDFNINLASQKTQENPIFAIQYTYARTCQLLLKKTQTIKIGSQYKEKEIKLIHLLHQFLTLLENISQNYKVHLLPKYLIKLSATFNSFYSNEKIIHSAREAQLLAIVKATKIIIKIGLSLLGIKAPEKI